MNTSESHLVIIEKGGLLKQTFNSFCVVDKHGISRVNIPNGINLSEGL